jgi:hypothetical protein
MPTITKEAMGSMLLLGASTIRGQKEKIASLEKDVVDSQKLVDAMVLREELEKLGTLPEEDMSIVDRARALLEHSEYEKLARIAEAGAVEMDIGTLIVPDLSEVSNMDEMDRAVYYGWNYQP